MEWKLYPVKTPNYVFETTEIILSVDLEYVVKSLLVRDLKSISELEKLWNEKRDTAGKMINENLVEVYCKIRSYTYAGLQIHQIYFMNVLEIGLE